MSHTVRRESNSTEPKLPVELEETIEGYILSIALPGVKPEHIELSTVGQRVTVVVDPGAAHRDRASERSFELPDRALLDEASARLERGVLRVVAPRRPQGKARRIPVEARD